jgi:hypothetical protein
MEGVNSTMIYCKNFGKCTKHPEYNNNNNYKTPGNLGTHTHFTLYSVSVTVGFRCVWNTPLQTFDWLDGQLCMASPELLRTTLQPETTVRVGYSLAGIHVLEAWSLVLRQHWSGAVINKWGLLEIRIGMDSPLEWIYTVLCVGSGLVGVDWFLREWIVIKRVSWPLPGFLLPCSYMWPFCISLFHFCFPAM